MRILDSSFLVAVYLDDDSHHAEAMEMAKTHSEEELLLPDPILFETLSVIRLNAGAPAARVAYQEMTATRQMALTYFDPEERKAILELFFSSPLSISAADASVAYLCQKLRVPALTFDKNLAKVIGKRKSGD